ncbi:hypothetical protein LCGC14_1347380 [marine sediment metagenome]|uniref:Uncharacterized protein n=1 Tax=marine sediment metagenome TaxID=412755 RepID=A0A0F9KBY5_9ZZZZ|nr:hypothetical protein [Methylophaga sp.]HEC60453.1 hypothetical protein [Methylophaga sp.]
MSQNKTDRLTDELTPLEKIESLYHELLAWYGDADKKEQRVAAKLLMVALDKFSVHAGNSWDDLVMEYMTILKNDPEQFERIIESNRGEQKGKPPINFAH